MIILVPLFIVICLFIWQCLVHLCLMIVGGANQSFETTFRVLAFSQGSAGPLQIIPLCGGLIAGVWAIVCNCIGLARAHETDTGRAVLAVFLPLIVCCGGGVFIAFMFGHGRLDAHRIISVQQMQFSVRRLAPGELDHELIWLSASVLSLGLAAAWLTLGLPWPRCVFHDLTSLPCVTCGMTRCGIQFFHGHFLAALQWNPLVFAVLCGVIAFDIYALATVW